LVQRDDFLGGLGALFSFGEDNSRRQFPESFDCFRGDQLSVIPKHVLGKIDNPVSGISQEPSITRMATHHLARREALVR
jgi:hypothetical protein